ncbi:MAG: cytochrome c biogenesis protein ResB [Desulfobulbaceae bacterium]|nr:cytochrome c biogenesis protein ResB [Desulfobulbaceae bacterium]
MLQTIKQKLLAHKTVLTLLLLLFGAILLSVIIPQQFNTPAEQFIIWQNAHQNWQSTIKLLGLHHIFTTPWFAVLLLLFLASLSVATSTQFRIAWRRSFIPETAAPKTGNNFNLPEEQLAQTLKNQGFFKLGSSLFIKHPWGHWGIFLLHLGILLSIAGSLLLTVNAKRGSIQLIEGETHLPTDPWLYEEKGIMAESFKLPEAFTLDRITPVFWPQGGIKNLISEVRFISADGKANKRTVTMNPILSYQNLRVYQDARFGRAFYVLFTDTKGNANGVVLDIPSPVKPDKASYGNFDFPEIPYTIKAKYYIDADKKNLLSDNPLLAIRLVELDKVLGQISLTKDQPTGQIGPYRVELVRAAQWSSFTFMTTPGITAVFFGFFIFSLGGLLYYFTIPREITCFKTDKGFMLSWKCARFREHYQDEYRSIIDHLKKMS